MSQTQADVTTAGREYRTEEAVSLWLTAQEAERRHLRIGGDGGTKPLVSASWLNQMRSRNDRAGRKPGDRSFQGPPYRKIGRRAFYPALLFDRWALGSFADQLVGGPGDGTLGEKA